jgi:hypothetical protein
MIKTFKLKFYGIEESQELDVSGMTEEEINEELVTWVLDRVDHWIEDEE